MFHFVAYIMLYLEIIVYEIPPGGCGVYSKREAWRITVSFFCDMGVPCSLSNNSKSI